MANRQDILDAVKARLQEILVANGYRTDLGLHVFEWKTTAFAQNEMPGITYRDTEENIRPLTGGMEDVSLTVELILCVSSGSVTMANLREAIDDVVKAIHSDWSWGGLAWDTAIGPIDAFADNEGKLTGTAKIVATVKFERQRP